MNPNFFEVKSGVLTTYGGEEHEVQGGAYLSPEHYLTTHGELERLRLQAKSVSPWPLVIGVAVLGFAAGYFVARRNDDE